MAPLLHWKIFLTILSKLRLVMGCTKCCLGRLARLLSAFLGREFSKWWHSRPGNPGTRALKPSDPPLHGTAASSYSVSGGPTIVKQYTVASSVPASTSLPNLHERVEKHPLRPSPEIITMGLPSLDHEDGRVSPVLQPSAPSPYAHRSLSPSPMNEIRRELSLTSFVVDVQNPTTESLPITPSATNPITDEPLTMESATAHSSPGSLVVNQHDEPIPGSTTPSNVAALDHNLPEFQVLPASVQPINSEDIPRYTKYALMQVEYTILSPHPHISLQTTRGDTL
jgi:hypothetical protein